MVHVRVKHGNDLEFEATGSGDAVSRGMDLFYELVSGKRKDGPTQAERLLELLSDGQWHHQRELHAICWRYSARLHDLKRKGVEHECERRADGCWYFRLAIRRAAEEGR